MLSKLLRMARLLGRPSPSVTEIHRETYWLGSRHNGNVLDGALLELKGLESGSPRAALLNAIIHKERAS